MASKKRWRSKARELALQALYQVDLNRDDDRGQINAFLRDQEDDKETRTFAQTLVYGVLDNQEEVDAMISKVTQNWAISRMAVIDRNVLRIAAHELLHCEDIPPKVSINEAIEIGKRFSTTNSGSFINGILDKIMNHHLPGCEGTETATEESASAGTATEGATDAPAEDQGSEPDAAAAIQKQSAASADSDAREERIERAENGADSNSADGNSADSNSADGTSADSNSADGTSADGNSADSNSAGRNSADGTSADSHSAGRNSADESPADDTPAGALDKTGAALEDSADGSSAETTEELQEETS